jgi:hypothetical protein
MERGGRCGVPLLLGVVLLVVGCVGPLQRLRSPGLESARIVAEEYGTLLRWGRVDEAAALVHPDLRSAFQRLLAGYENRVRITSFEVESIELQSTQRRAQAMVRYEIYRVSALVEESRREPLRLRWQLSSGRWYVEPDLSWLARNFGLEPVGSGP